MRGVQVIPLVLAHADARRSISEEVLPVTFPVKRVNCIALSAEALPEMRLGGHAHRVTTEWFLLAAGSFRCAMFEHDGEREVYQNLRAPCLIEVRAGIGHTFEGPEASTILITLADTPYDPTDTIPIPR